MTIKRRIEQLEKVRLPESSALDELFEKYAEPFESVEERKEIEKIIEQIDQNILATKKYWDAQKKLAR